MFKLINQTVGNTAFDWLKILKAGAPVLPKNLHGFILFSFGRWNQQSYAIAL